jgi:hypothetical protein
VDCIKAGLTLLFVLIGFFRAIRDRFSTLFLFFFLPFQLSFLDLCLSVFICGRFLLVLIRAIRGSPSSSLFVPA